jgi:hypothetical protein
MSRGTRLLLSACFVTSPGARSDGSPLSVAERGLSTVSSLACRCDVRRSVARLSPRVVVCCVPQAREAVRAQFSPPEDTPRSGILVSVVKSLIIFWTIGAAVDGAMVVYHARLGDEVDATSEALRRKGVGAALQRREVTVNGRRVIAEIAGEGSPTVVINSGTGVCLPALFARRPCAGAAVCGCACGCISVCGSTSALCPLPSALCPLPSALCPLRSALCALRSALCALRSALCPLPSSSDCIRGYGYVCDCAVWGATFLLHSISEFTRCVAYTHSSLLQVVRLIRLFVFTLM